MPALEKYRKILNSLGLEEFELIELLGKGSFGRVFKAKRRGDSSNLLYAVKLITVTEDFFSVIPETKFLEELYAKVKRCCPECIVNIYPSYLREKEEGLTTYSVIVADYVPKTLLSEEVRNLPLHRKVKLILTLTECIKHFLQNGFFYTDLKPANLGTTETIQRSFIIDLGGFKKLKTFVESSQTLTSLSSSGLLRTPLYAPQEFLQTDRDKLYQLYEDELKSGRASVYMLAKILLSIHYGEPQELVQFNELKERLKAENGKLGELIERSLKSRESRPSLEEFYEGLELILYELKFGKRFATFEVVKEKGDEKATVTEPTEERVEETSKRLKPELIENLKVGEGEEVELSDGIYEVKGDIWVEGGKLIIKDAELRFHKNGGIVVKDGTFIAENSKFLPKDGEWRNVTLIGDIKGHIKGCLFEGGRGRKGKFYNEIGGWNFENEDTYGGCLFVYSTKEKFLIKETTFRNCSATKGGGVYARENNRIENCKFDNCSAKYGGGVYARENNRIENCKFDNCSAKYGGGVYASKNNQIENCKFDNCSAEYGGGVYAGGWFGGNNRIENRKFNNCSANKSGGGVNCWSSDNTLRNNTYSNCKPDNTNCGD